MYTQIYCPQEPAFLAPFVQTPQMHRLSGVGMHCGCEYSGMEILKQARGGYSRLTHSVGAARIVWHFTKSRAQTLAALFHDISAPCFAHVVDFLNGDHLRQESTEDGIRAILSQEPIASLLAQEGISCGDVEDYHRYPIADNDTPRLSADRLEYTLGNAYLVQRISLDELQALYDDLYVAEDACGVPELAFQTRQAAGRFTRIALRNARWFVSDADRFLMQVLAMMLRLACERGTLRREALWTCEPEVIRSMCADPLLDDCWETFSRVRHVVSAPEPVDGFCLRVQAKKRWIDPLVRTADGASRLSALDRSIRRELRVFLEEPLDAWLFAEESGRILDFGPLGNRPFDFTV